MTCRCAITVSVVALLSFSISILGVIPPVDVVVEGGGVVPVGSFVHRVSSLTGAGFFVSEVDEVPPLFGRFA